MNPELRIQASNSDERNSIHRDRSLKFIIHRERGDKFLIIKFSHFIVNLFSIADC